MNRARNGGLLLGLGGALVGLACGPSFQAIYEGNARFEHCYALEESPQASMKDKASCWRDWSERYTYGQTRDRIHYATARYVALSEARDIPTDEALMMAAPGETPRRTTITAPAPTNAFAPPPKVLDPAEQKTTYGTHPGEATPVNVPVLSADGGMPVLVVAPPPLPQSTCSDNCGSSYRTCNAGCEAVAPDAGAKVKTCQQCSRSYRGCMRDCFK